MPELQRRRPLNWAVAPGSAHRGRSFQCLAEVAQEGGSRALLPTDPSVLDMDTGYGPDGASVQRADVGTLFMHGAKSCVPHFCAGPM